MEQETGLENLGELVLEHSPDIIALYDTYGNCVYTSPSCEAILGYPPKHFAGSNIYDLLEGEPAAEALQNHEAVLASDGKPLRIQNKFEKPSGEIVEVEASVALIPGVGANRRGLILVISRLVV